MSGITIAQILIDDSSDKTITGVWVFDRDGYGSLAIPALSYFPDPAEPGEILWRIDENKIYRRNDTNTAWTSVVADVYVPGSTAGSIIYYDGYEFVPLPPTTDGYVLTLNNSIPSWQLGGISISGQTHGSIIYYNGNEWVQLSPSTDGYVLTTHGDGYNPSWEQCVIELSNSNPENVTKFTASPGISPFAARTDHKHDISTASPIIIQIGNVTNEGISTALARADHSHAVYSDVPVSIGASNIEGADGYFARSDHQHAVTDLSITGQTAGSILYFDGYNWIQLPPGIDGYVLTTHGSNSPSWVLNYSGDVFGPSSSTDNAIVRFDGTTGKLIKDSIITIDGYGNVGDVGYIDFQQLSAGSVPYSEGRLFYDDQDRTLSLYCRSNEVTIQLGQELVLFCVNNNAFQINNGQAVYISGSQGNRPTIALADADGSIFEMSIMGLATEDIPAGESGYVTIIGLVRDVNTNLWPAGTRLYLSTTPGGITATPPTNGAAVMFIGICVVQHNTHGIIGINIMGPTNLQNLHDVYNGVPYDGYHLIGDGYWWNSRKFSTDLFAATGELTKEPTGFPTAGGGGLSTLSITGASFSITPVSGSYDIWVKGVKFTKSTVQSVSISDVEGLHFTYFDGYGVLQETTNGTIVDNVIQGDGVLVANVYWDFTNKSAIILHEERHGLQMDGATHSYLHHVFGSQYESGGGLSSFTIDGTGNLATNAQFAVEHTVFWDEDIRLNTANSSQIVSLPAQIPIYYRSGANGDWRKKTADVYPVIYSGTAGYTGANGRLPYNEWTGVIWQLTQLGEGAFVLVHYFATGEINQPIIGVQGQNSYATISAARAGADAEINTIQGTIRLLAKEEVPLGTVIFQTRATYANVPRARTVSTTDGSTYVDWRTAQLSGVGQTIVTTFSDGLFQLYDDVDITKKAIFQLSGITTGNTRTITVPDYNVTLGTDGYAIHKNISSEISAITPKVTPINTDYLLIEDSAASNAKKSITIGSLPFSQVTSTTAPLNVTKAAAAIGTDGYAARADHKHDISTAGAGLLQIGDVSYDGYSASLSRADHKHIIYAGTPVSIGASNIEGTDGYFARSDHQHAVTDLSITGQQEGSLLYYDGYNWAQLPPGTDGYYLKTNGTGEPPEWASVSTSSVKRTVTVEFCLTEEVNNTEKYFYTWKTTAAATDSERSGSGGGIQNANTCSPYQVPFNGTIIKALLTIKGVGVQNGTVTYPVTYQTDIFDIGFTTETKIGDADFSISDAYNVGTYSVGNTNFKGSTTLNVSVTECQLLGLKFINGNSASLAGQTKNAFVTLIIEET